MPKYGPEGISGKSKSVIWVVALTLASLFAGLKLAVRAGGAQIEYLSAALWLVRLLRYFNLTALVRPLKYDLGELRTADGLGLRFAIDREILGCLPQVLNALIEDTNSSHRELEFNSERVRLYLTKAAWQAVNPATTLVFLATACTPESGESPQLIIDATVASLMRDWPCLKGHVVHILNSPTQSRFKRWLHILGKFLGAVLDSVIWNARGISASLPAPNTAQIAVELIDGNNEFDITFYPWFTGSGISASQIMVLNHRPDTQMSAARAADISRAGHNWVNMRALTRRKSAHGRWQLPYFQSLRFAFSTSVRLIWRAAASESPLALWQAGQLMNLLWSVSNWEAFFRRHKIVAFMQTSETGLRILAQAIAIDRAGGMSFGTHWSHFTFDYIDHARDTSVYFSWGPFYKRKFNAEGWNLGQLVYIGHCSFPGLSVPSTGAFRKQLLQNGAKRVVCYFDTGYGSDLHYSRKMLVSLYVRLIEEVLCDPEFGLLIKPYFHAPAELKEFREILLRAEATGRCVVLDKRISPGDAAKEADCVVGAGFNSAVIQAVTGGTPGLHADLAGHKNNDFHTWGGGLVVFTDLESLMAGVRKCLAEGVGSPIGDHSPVLRQIDPFCDGEGARRMGRYLKVYLEAINSGAGRNESLARAKADYQAQFGVDSVDAVMPGCQPTN